MSVNFGSEEKYMEYEFKVSVIVPVYNSENFLKKCLDSLVDQTLKDIEIIVVNNDSPDDSLIIINKYIEKYSGKIILINSKTNLKAGGARNLGIKASRGEYVGFVDADD